MCGAFEKQQLYRRLFQVFTFSLKFVLLHCVLQTFTGDVVGGMVTIIAGATKILQVADLRKICCSCIQTNARLKRGALFTELTLVFIRYLNIAVVFRSCLSKRDLNIAPVPLVRL